MYFWQLNIFLTISSSAKYQIALWFMNDMQSLVDAERPTNVSVKDFKASNRQCNFGNRHVKLFLFLA